MALRKVLQFPDPLLRRISAPIEIVTSDIRKLADDMLEVMYDEPGIGLAAPQVSEPIRLIVLDTSWQEEGQEPDPIAMINPQIITKEGKITWTEGCLSVPDFTADVARSERVRIQAMDLDGNEIIENAEGLRAVCLQHELDHLDGILFIDRISRIKRSMYVKKRKKMLREMADDSPSQRSVLS